MWIVAVSVIILAPKLWNSPSQTIREADSSATFRRLPKTHQFPGWFSFSVSAGLTLHRNFSMSSQDFFYVFSFSYEKSKNKQTQKSHSAPWTFKSMEPCAVKWTSSSSSTTSSLLILCNHSMFAYISFSLDPNPFVRHTFWTMFIGGTMTTLTEYADNQAMLQRYLSMRSVASARWWVLTKIRKNELNSSETMRELVHRYRWLYTSDQQPLRMLVSSPQGGAADAEIKVPSGENTELKRSPITAWSRSVYSHTSYAYC